MAILNRAYFSVSFGSLVCGQASSLITSPVQFWILASVVQDSVPALSHCLLLKLLVRGACALHLEYQIKHPRAPEKNRLCEYGTPRTYPSYQATLENVLNNWGCLGGSVS